MTIKSPLARVKHLGSARSGTDHFIKQRITAIFMIPLLIWFVTTVVMFVQKTPQQLPSFITSPVTIIGAISFILNSFYHASLGLRMIIEDYVHHHTAKVAMLLFMYAVIVITVIAGLVSILNIYILAKVS